MEVHRLNTPTLVLLPGLLCDGRIWQTQTEALADVAQCVIADLSQDDSILALAARVLQHVQAPQFCLAGHSMGGYVALELMRQAPQRVQRLALISTQAGGDSEAVRARRLGLIELASRGRFVGVTDRLLPMLMHRTGLRDARSVALVKDMAREIGIAGFLRQQQAILSRTNSEPFLADIQCPTLILCGEQDALTPLAQHTFMANAIKNAQFKVIADCGHLPMLEQPAACAATLRDWLRG